MSLLLLGNLLLECLDPLQVDLVNLLELSSTLSDRVNQLPDLGLSFIE